MPKENKDFMKDHEIACEEELKSTIYVIPKLRDKILGSKIGLLRGVKLVVGDRTEETKHIYLFFAFGGVREKYTPIYDIRYSIPSTDYFDVGYGQGKPVHMDGKRLVFECEKVKTEKDEKKLRSYDVLQGGPGRFIFVNDIILDCMSHLIDKDIQVLPSEIYTKNGLLEGYHLIDVINIVYGVDKERSIYNRFTGYLQKLVPKNEDFMKGREMAREDEMEGRIYIVPTLREKILKAKKGKLKGLELRTAKEDWEAGRTTPY